MTLLEQTVDHKVSDRILLYLARLQFSTECTLWYWACLTNYLYGIVALATMG